MTLLRTREFLMSAEYNRHVMTWVSLPADIEYLSGARFKLNIGRYRSLRDDRPVLLGDLQTPYDARRAEWQAQWGDAEPSAERSAAIAEWNSYVASVDLAMKKRLASFLYDDVRAPGLAVAPADEESWLLLEPSAWWCPAEGRTDTLVLDVLTDDAWLDEVTGNAGQKKRTLITQFMRSGEPSLRAIK